MADNVAVTAGTGTTISTEEVTTLNGGAVAAQHVQRMLLAYRTADGTAVDAVGQKAMASSLPVTIASDQSAVPVSGTFFQATQPVSGTVTANVGTGNQPITAPTPTVTTGTLTTSTGTVPASSPWTDISQMANATVAIAGTYAGVNVTFEVSPDSGTNWFPIAGVREDSGIAESTSGVLPANTIRSWALSLFGFNRLRVRATAWTSGTANVFIAPGVMPMEPITAAVMQSPPRTSLILATVPAGVAAAAADTLVTLGGVSRGGAAVGSGSTFALTAGKTFRVQTMSIVTSGSAIGWAAAYLRYNPTGAVTAATSSPVLAAVGAGQDAAAGGMGASVSFADGLDIPAGTTPAQVGISAIGLTTTTIRVVVTGYEY